MKTVFVGLSGGVDSATAAYLLKKEGYNVVGAFIKGWEPDFLPCTGKEDRQEAMRVAAHLEIPFRTYNLEEEYKRDVVDYFVAEYKAGRTPNPDVLCNRVIKFGAFWEQAKNDGADFIATGHYARIQLETENLKLKTSRDSEKDQTYFLWTLTQDDLAHSLFPIGKYEKSEIRALALRAGLPNAARRDSQGLCFLGHVDMHAFLKRYIPEKVGAILDEEGTALGEHNGVWFYTIGQHVPVGGLDARRYVVRKNIEKNELVVSDTPLGNTPKAQFKLHAVNWVSGRPPEGKVMARYRYRQPLIPAKLRGDEILFETPQLVAEGQSCVLYSDDRAVYGGGIIG